MASKTGPIRVMHFGLGPIGAAVVRQVAERKGFKIVGAVDIDPAKAGRDLGEVAGVGRTLKVKVSDDAEEGDQGGEAGRRGAVHELVAEEGGAADRAILKLKVPIVSTTEELAYPTKAQHAVRARDPPAGEEGQGGGARHRRQSRLRDGRAADHADRRLRAGRSDPRRPHPGRAHPPAAVPAEDRRRPHARAVPEEGGRRERAARRAGRIGLDDRRRARLEAGSHHRRDPAEDRDRDGRQRVPRGRSRLRLRHRPGRHRLPRRQGR